MTTSIVKYRPSTKERCNREVGSVHRLNANKLQQFAEVLAAAFNDDPPTRWLIPDDSRRQDLLSKRFYMQALKQWLALGECLTTSNVVGAAAWIPPGSWAVSTLSPSIAMIYGKSTDKVLSAISILESNHPKEPHFYLPFAGVIPAWQGKGVGSALLSPVLARCDRDATPAYLEASSSINRRLYERHGFSVTEEFNLGVGCPPLWRMWREPNSTAEVSADYD